MPVSNYRKYKDVVKPCYMHECFVNESYLNVHVLCEMNSGIFIICIHLGLYNIFGTVLGEMV